MPKNRYLIRGARLVSGSKQWSADLLTEGERIARIAATLPADGAEVIEADGAWLLPGLIDTHVHFREPGFSHKGNIRTESRAAVLGGITSYLEMPNTSPATTSTASVYDKLSRAKGRSEANYGFYLGATQHNLEEVLRVPQGLACGLKLFMGASTGTLLVDKADMQEAFFSRYEGLIAVHAEDEAMIQAVRSRIENKQALRASDHPVLRPRAACLKATARAVALAKRHGTRLHLLHITTKEELEALSTAPLDKKNISAEACMQQLCFHDGDYLSLGNLIKLNPAIKTRADQEALWKALQEGKLDTVGSDHAPHTLEEKQASYWEAPAGAPMVGQSLYVLLAACRKKQITVERLVAACCQAPAQRYGIRDRGFLEEGMFADLVLVRAVPPWVLNKAGIAHHCGWSPLEGRSFSHRIEEVFVCGQRKIRQGCWQAGPAAGQALTYETT